MAAETKLTITGDASGVLQTFAQVSSGVQGFAKEVEGAVNGIKNMFLGFTAVLGGAKFLKSTVDETKNWTVEAQKLSRVLGITTEKASILNLAIGDIYGTQEEYLGAVSKLTRTLNGNEEAFIKLGVATRDQNGRLRDTPSIMAEVNQKLLEMKSGTDRNIATAQIYGRSWQEVQRYLKLTPEVMEEARAKAERLNLIVGGDAVNATEAYRASVNELEDTMKALKIRIGMEVMPALTIFNNAAAEEGPQAAGALGVGINLLTSAFMALQYLVQDVAVTLSTTLMSAWHMLSGLTEGLVLFIQGDYKEAAQAVKAGWNAVTNEVESGMEELSARYENMGLKLNQIWDKNLRPIAKTRPADGATGAASPTSKDTDKEFEQIKARYERYKYYLELASAERGEFHEITKAQEAAFWQGVLEGGVNSEKTASKVRQEMFKAKRGDLKKAQEDEKLLNDTYYEEYLTTEKAKLTEAGMLNEQALKNGLVTEQEALQARTDLYQAEYQLDRDRLEWKLAQGGLEVAEKEKIVAQLESLEAAHSQKMLGFTFQQADLDRQKDGWAGWSAGIRQAMDQAKNSFESFKNVATQVWGGVENAFATGVQGILSGQMSLSQGIKSIWKGIVATIIQAISQLIAKYIVLQIANAVLGKSEQEAAGAKATAYLTEGAAGAWAAYGAIPYVGAGLALAQIALMELSVAAVAAGGAGLAKGGSDYNASADASAGMVPGAAEGAWFGRPTLAMIGEGSRPELVVPDVSFKDFATNLTANILAQERSVQGYRLAAAGYAGGMGGLAPVQIYTGPILGESAESGRIIGDYVHRALQDRDRRNA